MTPPETPAQGPTGPGATGAPAVCIRAPSRPAKAPAARLTVLRRRADFLRAASARRHGTPGFLLQARERRPGEPSASPIRIGYTCSKKLGNAVARNRAKRRLREIARQILPEAACPGWDYVLVGRPEATASRDFAALQADLRQALARIHRNGAPT